METEPTRNGLSWNRFSPQSEGGSLGSSEFQVPKPEDHRLVGRLRNSDSRSLVHSSGLHFVVTSTASTLPWFEKLFADERIVFLVAVESLSVVGFLIAQEFPTPPVYDPGGATALIDDFCVTAKDRCRMLGQHYYSMQNQS
ncbi:hypothetical protein [Rhizobium populisoli]|uniref:hypothetical protein n=1 Tax=Rhizobium populisoli TaxID=2859785 RepID=UPI001FEC394D|nr:hypothetical protein [Rhizobium populisoli]